MKLKGGANNATFPDKESQKLAKSIIAHASPDKLANTKKFLGKLLNGTLEIFVNIMPILAGMAKNKHEQIDTQNILPSKILDPVTNQTKNLPQGKSRKSSGFAEAFPAPAIKRNRFNNKDSKELVVKYDPSITILRESKEIGAYRRAEPLYESAVLGKNSQYSAKQLERKAADHLKDFSTTGKSSQEKGAEYKAQIELLLQKPRLYRFVDGTLNLREPTVNIGHPDSRIIVVFEKDPDSDIRMFVTSYRLSRDNYVEYLKTRNIGISKETRLSIESNSKINKAQNKKKLEDELAFKKSVPKPIGVRKNKLDQYDQLRKKAD